jgi:uncharacterized protein (DUF1786 family)
MSLSLRKIYIKYSMNKIFTILFSFLSFSSFAQLEKTIHQTFNVNDAKNIGITMNNEYEIQTWPGDAVLVETNIKLENATSAILNFAVDSGRYVIVFEDNGNGSTFTLKEKATNRPKLSSKNGLVNEMVTVKIFIPEDFDASNKALLVKKSE